MTVLLRAPVGKVMLAPEEGQVESPSSVARDTTWLPGSEQRKRRERVPEGLLAPSAPWDAPRPRGVELERRCPSVLCPASVRSDVSETLGVRGLMLFNRRTSVNKPPHLRPSGDPHSFPDGAAEQAPRGTWPSFQQSGLAQAAGRARVDRPWSPLACLPHRG